MASEGFSFALVEDLAGVSLLSRLRFLAFSSRAASRDAKGRGGGAGAQQSKTASDEGSQLANFWRTASGEMNEHT